MDLHRENIDHLEIPSRITGKPPLRRIPEVFDCWFESGSMPYAQQHYPFENVKEFYETFPANFVAEGIDQTRGWFYTLLVISTALFGRAPFKNIIANGLILACDGQKMSKRKKNYPDPMEIVTKYGADALRLYLVNSPVVRAENLRFKEEGVHDIVKDVFLPWFNAFRFLLQNIEMYVQECNTFTYEEAGQSCNIMDVWIVSLTQSLLEHVHKEMSLYHLYNVIPRLIKYFDHLTNWYVRMNRKRFKGETGHLDQYKSLVTLLNVLLTITKLMAPFAPFLSEYIFQNIKDLCNLNLKSVHLLMIPKSNSSYINEDVERALSRLQEVVDLGRILRDKKTIPTKYPLLEMVIIHQNAQYLSDIKSLESYILTEMNIRTLVLSDDKAKYGVEYSAKADYKTLGAHFKTNYKELVTAIQSLTPAEIDILIETGNIVKNDQNIQLSYVRLIYKTVATSTKYEIHTRNDVLVLLDTNQDENMLEEGASREIINRIQKLRKKAHLVPTDKIVVYYRATKELRDIAEKYTEFISNVIKTSFVPLEDYADKNDIVIEEHRQFKGCSLSIYLKKTREKQMPNVKWANLLLRGFKNRYTKGMILLEAANLQLSFEELKKEVGALFDLYSDFNLWTTHGEITRNHVISSLSGQTIVVCPINERGQSFAKTDEPYCNFLNFCKQEVLGTVILENPVGIETVANVNLEMIKNKWINI